MVHSVVQSVAEQPVAGQPAAAPRVDVAASVRSGGGASASAVLDAAKARRSELRSQVDRLEGQREDLSREVLGAETAAKPGIEARLKLIDARIVATEQQLAEADQAVADAAAVPGAVVPPPPFVRNGPPEELIAIPIVFTLFVLFPLTIAYARRIWRRGATVVSPVPQEVRDRLEQVSQAVESIALEVERIGEGQRFITRVMSENGRVLSAGPAQPIPVAQAQAERQGVRPGA